MIKNYFLITFRSMMKNKVFIMINVLGMGVAIACCIVSYFAYEFDADFDAQHVNGSKIYRIGSLRDFDNTLTRFGSCPLPLGEVIRKTFPDVNQLTRYVRSSSNLKRDDDLFAANLSYVDPDFFELFSFDFVAGDRLGLKNSTSLLISENMAIRLYRNATAAVGQNITQVYGKEKKELKIAGVFREPAMNSSFFLPNGSAYLNFENYKDEKSNFQDDDWTATGTLFVEVAAEQLGVVKHQLQAYTANNNKAREDFQVRTFTLDPFTSLARDDRAENVQGSTWAAPPQSAIVGSMIMSVLIVLIACFNLTNTAIAISTRRLKEIGIRKVMGSMRLQLIFQFITETTSICFLALIVALGLADLLINGWNLMTQNNIHLEPHYLDSPGFILFLTGMLIITGVLAGSYPAFYISKFKPASILKGNLTLGGTNYFTRSLLAMQFVVSLITIVSAIGFLQNARYQKEYDLGFDVRGAIVASVEDQTEFETYRNALLRNPQIISVAGAQSGIFSNRNHEPVKHKSLQAEVDIIEVGDGYLSTMDLKLINGRDFIKDSETDRKESVIVTQKMASLFGWSDPIGKEVIWKDSIKLYVVGLVKDVYTQGLWREMEPMMIRYVLPEKYSQIVVSTKASDVPAVNVYMNQQWNETFPTRLYNGYILSTVLDQANSLNMSIVYGYTFLGAVALLLSATGLFTLVSVNMNRRMKEIGVRKIVGASVGRIMGTVNKEFIIILAVASLLGSWAGYAWCNTIMSTIWKYYQGVSISTFIWSVFLLFVISIATIGYKVFSIASMNPVKSLRNE